MITSCLSSLTPFKALVRLTGTSKASSEDQKTSKVEMTVIFTIWNYLSAILMFILIKWLIEWILHVVRLPPGPWGLPVVGYIPWIKKNTHESLIHVSAKYGPVFSITLGHMTAVVLNDWPSIKASLVDSPAIFSGRPDDILFDTVTHKSDVATQDGNVWKIQRNLMIKIFKNLGSDKKAMETSVMDMVHNMMDNMKMSHGKLISTEQLFIGPLVSFFWTFMSGHNFNSSDPDMKDFEDTLSKMFCKFSTEDPIGAFPWLRFIPPNGFGFWETIKMNEKLRSHLKKLINQKLSEGEESIEDFIGFYLAENKKKETENGKSKAPYTVDNLLGSLWDLFFGGVDAINSTCLWGVLFLACNPDVQKKAQDEIDAVIGRNRLPNLDDISSLPYFKALIMEIHRKATVGPVSMLHRTLEDTKILGRNIPKGTICIQNIYAVHFDPNLWEEPQLFKPERFLDKNYKPSRPPYLMPFSLGPRMCPGLSIAELNLRLIFSCLLHKFTFIMPENLRKTSFDSVTYVSLCPKPFSLIIQARDD